MVTLVGWAAFAQLAFGASVFGGFGGPTPRICRNHDNSAKNRIAKALYFYNNINSFIDQTTAA